MQFGNREKEKLDVMVIEMSVLMDFKWMQSSGKRNETLKIQLKYLGRRNRNSQLHSLLANEWEKRVTFQAHCNSQLGNLEGISKDVHKCRTIRPYREISGSATS